MGLDGDAWNKFLVSFTESPLPFSTEGPRLPVAEGVPTRFGCLVGYTETSGTCFIRGKGVCLYSVS